jgi:uncharacterized membrane protein YeaQ/YmgE (transglycosylase-associated protein family)
MPNQPTRPVQVRELGDGLVKRAPASVAAGIHSEQDRVANGDSGLQPCRHLSCDRRPLAGLKRRLIRRIYPRLRDSHSVPITIRCALHEHDARFGATQRCLRENVPRPALTPADPGTDDPFMGDTEASLGEARDCDQRRVRSVTGVKVQRPLCAGPVEASRPSRGAAAALRHAARGFGFLDFRTGQPLVMFLHIVVLIVLGLLGGALGRLFHPGRDRMGILMTMAIGVASVVLAGLLIGGLLGFILAVVIGVVLVALWSHLVEARRAPKWKRRVARRLVGPAQRRFCACQRTWMA